AEVLSGSRIDSRIARLSSIGRLKQPWRSVAATVAAAIGQPRAAQLLRATGRKTAAQMEQMARAISDYRRGFLAAMDAQRLDALLFPPHALAAPPHGATIDLPPSASYCFLANLLGIPAGV